MRILSEQSHYGPQRCASFSSIFLFLTQWLSLSSCLPLRSVKYKQTHKNITNTHTKRCSHRPQRHTSSHHFSTLFLLLLPLLSLPRFLCSLLSFLAPSLLSCFSRLLSLIFFHPFLPVFFHSVSLFVGGEHQHLKSLLRRTPSVTFMNHILLYLFFHFLPLPCFVVFLYTPVSLCGASPHSRPATLPFPAYCPARLSILSSFLALLAGTL